MNGKFLGTPIVSYVPALVMLVITVLYLMTAYTYGEVARLLPVAVGWIMLALLALDLVSRTKTSIGLGLMRVLNPSAEDEDAEERPPLKTQMSAILWPVAFTAGLMLVGVLISVPLYVFLSMRFHGRWSWLWSAITALITTVCIYLLFDIALQVRLYPGMLLENL
jgi:putative tricarboxylic transport membrane protein